MDVPPAPYKKKVGFWVVPAPSTRLPVMFGLMQGPVLGPSLFWFYINDGITSTVRLFADDMIAYLTIKFNWDYTTLQNDLDKLIINLYGNKMDDGLPLWKI